jgi:hypothetical protein
MTMAYYGARNAYIPHIIQSYACILDKILRDNFLVRILFVLDVNEILQSEFCQYFKMYSIERFFFKNIKLRMLI